jgi:hypothetical protein
MLDTGSPPPRRAALAVPAAPSRAPAPPQQNDAASAHASVASPLDQAPHVTALNLMAQRLNAGPAVSAQRKMAGMLATPRVTVAQRKIVGPDREEIWDQGISDGVRDEQNAIVKDAARRLHSMKGEVRVEDYAELRRKILAGKYKSIVALSQGESAQPAYQPALPAAVATSAPDAQSLAALGTPSGVLSSLGGMGSWLVSRCTITAEKPELNAKETAAIDNWVAGGWGMMQAYARAASVPADAQQARDEAALIGRDVAKEVGSLDAVLEKLPGTQGKSYRRADYAILDVYSRIIRPGTYVGSPAFFASSRKKGASGAGGGAAAWGKGRMAYFEISGVEGRDLGPHQSALGGEEEILFPRGTVFRVQAIEIDDETVKVLLDNVPEAPAHTVIRDPYSGLDVTQQIAHARTPAAASGAVAPPPMPQMMR